MVRSSSSTFHSYVPDAIYPLLTHTLGFLPIITTSTPTSHATLSFPLLSPHPTNLLPQSLKLRLARTEQIPYLPLVLYSFMPFEFLPCVFLHLFSRWGWDLVACADDGAVEGDGALAEEEVGEGEG